MTIVFVSMLKATKVNVEENILFPNWGVFQNWENRVMLGPIGLANTLEKVQCKSCMYYPQRPLKCP